MDDLIARVERLKTGKKAKSVRADESPATTAKVIQLPFWPEPVRAVPNGFLRSALFGAVGRGRRRYLEREPMASLDGIEVRYTGQRLDQGDLDTWESILHAVRLQDLGSKCHITGYQLLKLMGKTLSGKNREILQSRIERLVANALIVKHERYTYIGSLISSAVKDDNTNEWIIELDDKITPLFGVDQYSHIQWDTRKKLGGSQMAQWLHGFYSSHANPYPIKVETLLRLTGSENSSLKSGKQKLIKALEAVKAACSEGDTPFDYEIKAGLVVVNRQPVKTQIKHLAKKKRHRHSG
ncbi:MAG: hypothetical protein IBX50_16965 [Marinospirillum sp.]|uniref:plasmid replication initiator TrfA n=1 Tax=Marinospirillum sp. TaxID=2183934 RepID=UPI0019EC4510|nr:plasmid replication initiator TrfA [Marinospirillum sp.]MBE0508382.1 hypothetical protein [Marinospirillum sp.]